ncbi:MAG: hypothetical protein P8N49_02905 [Opitutales bacterium]|nr:hypothetical protein [Opitutales bacterium]
MDSIQGYDQTQPRLPRNDISGKMVRSHSPLSSDPQAGDRENVSLTDIGAIARRADASSPDIRPDAIARAQALLNDPDWLSDESLDALAEKLIDTENL